MRKTRSLTVKEVASLPASSTPYSVGGGLGLFLRKTATGSGNWFIRFTSPVTGKRRDKGLGSYPEVTLAQANQKAKDLRSLIASGTDPIEADGEAKARAESARLGAKTFEAVAREWRDDPSTLDRYKNNHSDGPSAALAREYRRLEKHVFPSVGEMPFTTLTPRALADCFRKVSGKPKQYEKVVIDVRKVFRYGITQGLREDNPVDAATDLAKDARGADASGTEHYAACDIHEIPRLMEELLRNSTASAQAIAFSILTAARSQAVRLARWKEFDLKTGIWTIPREHDKIKRQGAWVHRDIFLSPQALDVLRAQASYCDGRPDPEGHVFLSQRQTGLGKMAFSLLLKRMHEARLAKDGRGWIDPAKEKAGDAHCRITAHGTARASFRTWCETDEHGNRFHIDQKAAELCLLHAVTEDERLNHAYTRATLDGERRRIMALWGRYCLTGEWPADES